MTLIKNLVILFLLTSLLFACSCKKNKDDTADTTSTSLTENQLLDAVQTDVIKYFTDFAESNSGLARERYHTDEPYIDQNIITTGGSGFGLMSIIVGADRGLIERQEAVAQLTKALEFLQTADRFHGAWSHWINGNTGKVFPFGTKDDGADLVETSYLCQGLICVREYFKNGTPEEQELAFLADTLWKGVDFNFFTQGQNVLFWHWSPNYGWEMNMKIEGFNECLITYVLAASSPHHPISKQVYQEGWARNGAIVTDRKSYNIPLIFNHNGTNTVGSLFWSHYSFLGLDPNGLTDDYGNFEELTKNHTNIIHAYCVENPLNWGGYSNECWGLTASYTRNSNGTTGYTDHRPGNDRGVISPTAALSSYPYTPDKSLNFLRFIYEKNSDKYVGICGPFDAFSTHHNWVTKRYLAIDQGPIAPMIENYRTGLLWELFMNAPDVKAGLINLGFHSTKYGF
ncbi:MAG: beta-glucosidase [Bacteroidales bacterium]|nr:beta-glucosidase [Bacteroidales bacterium]